MSDSYLTVLASIIARLKADGTVSGYVGARVYSDIVDNPTFPFLRVTINSEDYSTKDTPAMVHTIQVSCFSREQSPLQSGNIRAAVYNSLNRAENSLVAAGISNILMNGVSFTIKETDGKTWNSTVQFRAVTL